LRWPVRFAAANQERIGIQEEHVEAIALRALWQVQGRKGKYVVVAELPQPARELPRTDAEHLLEPIGEFRDQEVALRVVVLHNAWLHQHCRPCMICGLHFESEYDLAHTCSPQCDAALGVAQASGRG
jgi:hypothetical protein